ncbi:hypothetical protein JOD57_003902 [Geodermatophilus bullaregiensis]|nr:hypothetical protein [Geodermatophilus bullaregiensis]
MRARLPLFRDLREQHTAWVQRIHAILLHHGAPAVTGGLLGLDSRRRLEAGAGLSPAGREAVAATLRILDALDAELDPLRRQITAFAAPPARLPGAAGRLRHRADHRDRVVDRAGRLGPLLRLPQGGAAHRGWTSPCTPRTANGRPGTCPAKDRRCCAGRCSRPPSAPPAPALPITPTTGGSPSGSGGNRAALSVAGKMARRAHQTLRALGDQALAPV